MHQVAEAPPDRPYVIDRRRPADPASRGAAGAPLTSHGRRWGDRLPRPVPEADATDAIARRDGLYKRALAYADMISAGAAVLLGTSLLGDDRLTMVGCAALPLVVLAGKVSGLYDGDEDRLRKTTLDEAPGIFHVATLYALIVWLLEGWMVEGALGHSQVLGMWGLLGVSMLAARAVARRLVRAATPAERCLVLGDGAAAEWVRGKLEGALSLKATIVGRVPLDGRDREDGEVPRLGTMDLLGLVLAQHEVDRVVIAPSRPDSEEILAAIRVTKSLGVRVTVLPRLLEVVGAAVQPDEVEGTTFLGVRRHGLTRSSLLLKRSMDLVGAGLLLLPLAPLMAAIALAIKLDSRGPVLFRQPRSGRRDKPFEVLKFRTMVDGAEAQKAGLRALNEAGDGLFKIADDPRITRVGRFLRRTSLDELPQLFNVLRGDMSLVGPRPLVLDEDRRILGWSRTRSEFTPGMTGPWQILGSTRVPLHDMVKIDYLYGSNWTLWQDIKILLRTIPCVVGRRGL